MDAGLMGEGVASDDGFVGLYGDAGDFAEQLARGKKMLGGDARLVWIAIVTDAHGHDDLFKRRVAGPLTNPVDGAFDLAGSGGDRGHGIGDRHAEIVMTMGGDSDVLDSLDAAADGCDQLAEFRRDGIADGIQSIERRSSGFDYRVKH